LTVLTNGNGKVTPNSNGKYFEVGKPYTLTALPAIGQVFSNWTGSILTNSARLSFLMRTGLMLQANFVPNPFIPVKGSYNGLFYETNGVLHESSGFFTLTLTARGTFSLRMRSNGKSYALSGQFNLDGRAVGIARDRFRNALMVELQSDLATGTDRITGRISNGMWLADLVADRAVFHARTNRATRFAGKYTVVIPGSTNGVAGPGGDGFGTATVSLGGIVKMSGTLADNTRSSQRVSVSTNGHWPFYVSLYGGKGSLLSWMAFTNRPADDLHGLLSWIKPSLPSAKYYPAGFTNEIELIGSLYRPPVGRTNHAVQITNGMVVFSGGNLNVAFTNQVRIGANNKVTNDSPNKLTLTLVPSSGLFRGTVTMPGTNKTFTFTGVLLQKQTNGSGFFLGTNQSGRVHFQPAGQ